MSILDMIPGSHARRLPGSGIALELKTVSGPSRRSENRKSPSLLHRATAMTLDLPDRTVKVVSENGDNTELKRLLEEVLGPESAPLTLTTMKGGITNQLIKAGDRHGKQYLVRAFGKGTGEFINRDREYAVHQQLMDLGLAPNLVCRFGNGLVYEYLVGRPVLHTELSDPELMMSVANRLAQWHAQLRVDDVQKRMPNQNVGNLWGLLDSWIEMLSDGVLQWSKDRIRSEFGWIKAYLSHRGGPEVMGHCDLLSGNIICTEGWKPKSTNGSTNGIAPYTDESRVSFIDYEYALPCPRAFDIANHFQEWQGFQCDKNLVPEPTSTDNVLRSWSKYYLQAYAHYMGEPVSTDLPLFIDELAAWWGMPGFYWGIWSAIQSMSSDIDFDYAKYAPNRLSEYINWKKTVWPRISGELLSTNGTAAE